MSPYNDLPSEIISKIYMNLNVNDMKSAGLTCHQWLNALNLEEIKNRTKLIFTYVDDYILEIFEKSIRTYSNICLINPKNVNADNYAIENLIKLFSIPKISDNLKILRLYNIPSVADIKNLHEILKLLPNLEEIEIIGYNDEKFHNNVVLPKLISSKIRSLKLICDLFKDGYIQLFSNIKTLEELEILYRFNSCTKYCLTEFCQLCQNNKNNLKKLKLAVEDINFESLEYPLSNLKLTELALCCENIGNFKFTNFIKTQNLITTLSLPKCNLRDDNMLEILKYLPLLENLKIVLNDELTNATIFEISKLENLKALNINRLLKLTNDCIINGLAKNKNFKITVLECEGIQFSIEDYKIIAENLPNLQVLHCGHSACDIPIQHVIKNCKNLISLNVRAKTIICDELNELSLPKLTHLGLHFIDIDLYFFFKVRMEKLMSLNLGEMSFHSKTTGMFVNMIKSVEQNTPSIEKLTFNTDESIGGYGLDNAIEIIKTNLKQLKELNISIACKCKVQSSTQKLFLKKHRSDLSKIDITCSSEICNRIKTLSENFIDMN